MSRVLVLFLLALESLLGVCLAEVRGIHPNKKQSYNPSSDFTCLDGSDTIPFGLVNDDYCDCRYVVKCLVNKLNDKH